MRQKGLHDFGNIFQEVKGLHIYESSIMIILIENLRLKNQISR